MYGKIKDDLNEGLETALREHRFTAVILDAPVLEYPPFLKQIERYYRSSGPLLKEDLSFTPINTRRLNFPSDLRVYRPR